MSKKFKDWREEYDDQESDNRFKKKDGKRYDKKKQAVQNARKTKKNMKNSWMDT